MKNSEYVPEYANSNWLRLLSEQDRRLGPFRGRTRLNTSSLVIGVMGDFKSELAQRKIGPAFANSRR